MDVRAASRPDTAATVSIFIRPNRSLPRFRLLMLFAGFAAIGAWPSMPFAGLELVVMCGGFDWIDRHTDDFEEVVFGHDRGYLIRRHGQMWAGYEFQRYWTWVQLNARTAACDSTPLKEALNNSILEYSEQGRNLLRAISAFPPSVAVSRNLLLQFLHSRHPWRSAGICSCNFCIPAIHGGQKARSGAWMYRLRS